MKRYTQASECPLTPAAQGTFTPCLSSGTGGSIGQEAVSSRLNSDSAFYLLALSPGQGTDLLICEVLKIMPTLRAQRVVTNICKLNMFFQSVRFEKSHSSILFSTVHPNHNIMEGFNFGDSPHPVLRGLLCRGKVISVWFLLFFQGDKQIKGLILHGCSFFRTNTFVPISDS